jgi:hypothetical protein
MPDLPEDLLQLRLCAVREAVREHRVSFPAQLPLFEKQCQVDIQWRVVLLFFVLGWSYDAIGRRYGLGSQRIRQLIRNWLKRAFVTGYVQPIPAVYNGEFPEDTFNDSCLAGDASGRLPGSLSERVSGSQP